ncbi:MAG TPA: RDD family protein [Nannocystaceae bacterium]|nr:RDD family protein [Nannocystaceae bacterium]
MYAGPDGPNPYAPPIAIEEPAPLPYVDEHEAPLASRGRRFGGAFIDGIAYAVSGAPLLASDAMAVSDFAMGLGLIGLLAVGLIQCVMISSSGQSIGKKLLGMRIVRLDGSPCGFKHGVALRSWLFGLLTMIPYIGNVLSLVDALAIFGGERRCLHDSFAGTKVVMTDLA